MREQNFIKLFLLVLLILVVAVFFGCDNKTEKSDITEDDGKTEQIKKDTPPTDDDTLEIVEPDTEPNATIADVTSTWTGMFDKRSTVLNINEQTDSIFQGKISISYREKINQDVKGSFSPTTMKMTMKDQLHSRYRGTYNGKLSEDGKNFSGTFTMDLDGSKFSFNLNKK